MTDKAERVRADAVRVVAAMPTNAALLLEGHDRTAGRKAFAALVLASWRAGWDARGGKA